MNNKLSNLTVNILTYKTNREILNNCIDSISNEVTINIIENSKKFENEEYIKNKKKNINIFCTGINLGYSVGLNFVI